MAPVRFDRFLLDPQDRRLTRDGETVEISGRYLDALALLVAERGRLVTKDRFMAEVWKGVPVTDEALTQCVRALRRELGDDAARPRFIETVPKHGYRFVAEVMEGDAQAAPSSSAHAAPPPTSEPWWRRLVPDAGAGMTGGGLAGVIGGLFYGLAAAPQGMGGASSLIVLVCATTLLALVGGAAVGLGVALGRWWRAEVWGPVLGGALGGALVGGVTRLIGLDAFRLLTGAAPSDMTGAGEGLVLGAAAGLGAWLATRPGIKARTAAMLGGLAGAAAGLGIALVGGRLLGGSLDLLLRAYPNAPLSLDPVGRLFGQQGFSPVAGAVTATLEGALFAACLALTTALVRRQPVGSPVGVVGASGSRG